MLGFKFDEVLEAQKRFSDELEGVEQEIRQEIDGYTSKE